MRLYLSGPMRGLPEENHPRFAMLATLLRAKRYRVFSPPELSAALLKERGLDPTDFGALPFEEYLRNDYAVIATQADAVAVLPGWERSQGATGEVRVARELGLPILWAEALADGIAFDSEQARVPVGLTALQEAQGLVHGSRNADYGHPADNDARIADLLNALFGWGVKTTDVWMINVVQKLSRERNQPKHDNRVDIAGYAEVGDWIHRDGRAT